MWHIELCLKFESIHRTDLSSKELKEKRYSSVKQYWILCANGVVLAAIWGRTVSRHQHLFGPQILPTDLSIVHTDGMVFSLSTDSYWSYLLQNTWNAQHCLIMATEIPSKFPERLCMSASENWQYPKGIVFLHQQSHSEWWNIEWTRRQMQTNHEGNMICQLTSIPRCCDHVICIVHTATCTRLWSLHMVAYEMLHNEQGEGKISHTICCPDVLLNIAFASDP